MATEKRRFNRIDVSLTADVVPVDINLDVLPTLAQVDGLVVNLGPTGMSLMTSTAVRAGARYRVTLNLPDAKPQVFALVKHVAIVNNGTQFRYSCGLQTVGATEEDILTILKFLVSVTRTNNLLSNCHSTRPTTVQRP